MNLKQLTGINKGINFIIQQSAVLGFPTEIKINAEIRLNFVNELRLEL